jgi:hypothetical protein
VPLCLKASPYFLTNGSFLNLLNVYDDDNGTVLKLNITINNQKITLVNVYTPQGVTKHFNFINNLKDLFF